MSDDTTKKPSADDILDDLAAEMGVEDDETTADVDSAKEKSTSDAMADLQGVFAVSSGSKKKKKKKKPEAKRERKPSSKPKADSAVGLFRPGGDDEHIDIDSLPDPGGDDDFDAPQTNPVNKLLVAIIVILVLGGAGAALAMTDLGSDLVLLAKGNYQEEKQREARRLEREHLEAQLAAMPRYGNLIISGRPQYATIRLNGQIPYGQTSDGQWRALSVGPQTAIQDLSIDTIHEVEVEAPGHESRVFTITPEMWKPHAADYLYEITATLTPLDGDAFDEFTTRMEGVEGKFYTGAVNFTTTPPGAQIKVNSRVALDKDGEELRTPVTVEKFWLRNEEDDSLKEYDFRVDMPANRGNRIELIHPDDEELPQLVMALQRAMWDCQWKDEAQRKRLPKNSPILDHCDYVYDLNLDFNGLQTYIAEREAERERIESQAAQVPEVSKPTDG